MTETVTRLRPGTTSDRYGNASKTWDDPDRLCIDGCRVAPRTDPENPTDGREARVVGWTVYAPDGVDILATDRVEVRGETLEVDGLPADWSGGWGWRAGVEIRLRRGVG